LLGMKKSLFLSALMAVSAALAGCKTNPAGKVPVDTTIVKYKAPDIAELTGIDEDDGSGDDMEPSDVPADDASAPAPTPATPAVPPGKTAPATKSVPAPAAKPAATSPKGK
jgi:hypothetical protein